MSRSTIRSWLLILAVSALSALVGVRLNDASATHDPITSFAGYSYSDSGCQAVTDPIGVVFTNGNGSYDHVYQHAQRSDHGAWGNTTSSTQYFYEYQYGCSSNDFAAASNNGFLRDRYHMRWEADWISTTGHSYASTPHYDDYDYRDGTHCIRPAPSGGWSGFTQGVQNLLANWLYEHPDFDMQWWGNNYPIQKCHTWTWYCDPFTGSCYWVPNGYEYAAGDG